MLFRSLRRNHLDLLKRENGYSQITIRMAGDNLTHLPSPGASRHGDTPVPRVHEASAGHTVVSAIVGSAMTPAQKVEALGAILGMVGASPGPGGPGTGGNPPQGPQTPHGKPWIVAGAAVALVASLALDVRAWLAPEAPTSPDPTAQALGDVSRQLEELTQNVAGLREELESARSDQAEWNDLGQEAIGDLADRVAPGDIPDSVGYLRRLQSSQERKNTNDK